MKRFFCLMLALLAISSLTACGAEKPAPTQIPTETAGQGAAPTDAPTLSPTEMPVETYPLEQMALVENDSCAFTVLGVVQSAYAGTELQVLCENRTDSTAIFAWDTVSVCGYMYDPMWSQEVPAGERVTGTVSIDTFTLEQCGVTRMDEISFRLTVFDAENWMDTPYVADSFTVYPTGLSAEEVAYPVHKTVAGETVLLDEKGLVFSLAPGDEEGSDYQLPCYVENNTDRTVIFSWDAVTVNGVELIPAWSLTVASGKRACSVIVLPGSELAEAGAVEEIVFTLIAADYDDAFGDEYLVRESYTYQPALG